MSGNPPLVAGTTALERAFELARSGRVSSMTELRLVLKAEHFTLSQVSGPFLTRQLTALIRENRPANPPEAEAGADDELDDGEDGE